MKWGRKKSASPTNSIINSVFPVSWFSRLRQKRSSISETNSASRSNEKHTGGLHDFPTPNASLPGGRFCNMDGDDAYGKISFSQERLIQQGRRSTGGINPLWFDDSDRDFELPVRFKSLELGESGLPRREEECQKFSDMVSDVTKMTEKQKHQTHDGALIRGNGDSGFRCPKGNYTNGQNSRKLSHRVVREKQQAELEREFDDRKVRGSNSGENDIFPIELDRNIQKHGHVWKSASPNSRKQPKIPNFHLSSPVEELKVRTESASRSAYTVKESSDSKRTKNKSRAKAYSPRSECKIRALEDMKKARIKCKKKGAKRQVMEEKTSIVDSFAVVKSSYNPQKDFRASMVEMIREKRIWRRVDLEELLACYLTLNCDKYHDLIIKVFRQVWFEIGAAACSDNGMADVFVVRL